MTKQTQNPFNDLDRQKVPAAKEVSDFKTELEHQVYLQALQTGLTAILHKAVDLSVVQTKEALTRHYVQNAIYLANLVVQEFNKAGSGKLGRG
jgi:hypothetical protein